MYSSNFYKSDCVVERRPYSRSVTSLSRWGGGEHSKEVCLERPLKTIFAFHTYPSENWGGHVLLVHTLATPLPCSKVETYQKIELVESSKQNHSSKQMIRRCVISLMMINHEPPRELYNTNKDFS